VSAAASTAAPVAPDGQIASTAPPGAPAAEVPREVCPLCGGPLRRDQDWCLRCGATPRTRLAAPPKWKLLVVSLVSVVVLALAVLVVALVTLAG
jgi:hypothetical protein